MNVGNSGLFGSDTSGIHKRLNASIVNTPSAGTNLSSINTDAQEPHPRSIVSSSGKMIEESGGFSLAPVQPQSLKEIENAETGESALLTKETIERAFSIVEPAIMQKLNDPSSPRDGLHIVLLDPVKVTGGKSFSECVVFEKSINKDGWDIDLETLARKKAFVSYRYGMDSHKVQQLSPLLYQSGDNKYAGAINRDGFVVSSAGIEWYYDELFSKLLADSCEAVAKEHMDSIMTNSKIHFVESPEKQASNLH